MSDLRDDLTAIDGVGDKTAEKIMDVLADHGTPAESPLLEKAIQAARDGDDRMARIYLARYAGEE